MDEKRFLLILTIFAFLARLILAPLYVSPPGYAYSTEPHDFPKYMADVATILEGRVLYVDITHDGSPSPYGPLLVMSWTVWVKAFGTDYTLFKIPSIIYDTLSIILIFYITKSLFNAIAAKYASLLYAFSFIPLLISGADASSDVPLVFFLLLSVYFLIKSKPNLKLSAVFLGVALLFKLVLGAIFIPLVFYYFLQQKKIRHAAIHLILTILTIFLVTLPFFLKAGTNVFVQLAYPADHTITGTTFLSGVKMVVNFFTLGMTNTYNDNPLIQHFSLPFMIASLLGGAVYIIKFGLRDKRIELVRNIVVLILLVNIFGTAGYWHIFFWIVPYVIILFLYNQPFKKFKLPTIATGLVFVVVSTVLYATFYRETKIPEYTTFEQLVLISSVLLATAGTYMSFSRTKFAPIWAFSTLAWGLWLTNHAKLALVLGTFIPIFKNPLWAYGIQDFSAIVLIIVSNILLFIFCTKPPVKTRLRYDYS